MRIRNSVALLLVCAASHAFSQELKNVWNGVYTAAQADRGAAVFEMKCARCHEGADVDGPPLTGDPFIDRWREDTLNGLYSFIREKMPQDGPGKLEPKAYVDVLAFVLSENGIPPGNQELTEQTIPATLLTGKDGPQPLPPNALVKVIGCLTEGADKSWTLTKAADPARVRDANETTAAELAAAASKPLGIQTVDLANLDDLTPPFAAAANKGHKVMVKGVLERQRATSRINVLSAGSLAADCAR
jgi:S-disulfanyl-L-cysteine oxidoreductase SoxD